MYIWTCCQISLVIWCTFSLATLSYLISTLFRISWLQVYILSADGEAQIAVCPAFLLRPKSLWMRKHFEVPFRLGRHETSIRGFVLTQHSAVIKRTAARRLVLKTGLWGFGSFSVPLSHCWGSATNWTKLLLEDYAQHFRARFILIYICSV